LQCKEGLRRKTKLKYDLIKYFAFSQFVLPYFLCFYMLEIFPVVFFYSIIFPFFLLLEVLPKIEKKFLKEIKTLVVARVLKYFDNISWSYNSEIVTKEELYNAGVTSDNRFGLNFDDEFVGTYKNVKFRIGDSRWFGENAYGKERKIRIGNNDCSEKSGIDAVLILFKTNKFVNSRVIAIEKASWKEYWKEYIFLICLGIFCLAGFIARAWHDITTYKFTVWQVVLSILVLVGVSVFGYMCEEKRRKRELNDVVLEDVAFKKQFTLEAGDEVEARYLMTTSFMERLKKLKTVFHVKKIECRCWDDNVLFVLHTNKNLFEFANLHKPLSDLCEIESFCKELQSIYDMIDYFKFNENTKL